METEVLLHLFESEAHDEEIIDLVREMAGDFLPLKEFQLPIVVCSCLFLFLFRMIIVNFIISLAMLKMVVSLYI